MRKERLPIVYLSSELAQKTASLLDSFAQVSPSEGVVYWFGLEEENTAVVTTLIVPDADTTAGSVSDFGESKRRCHARNCGYSFSLSGPSSLTSRFQCLPLML